jgi:hypothetical protein
MDTREDLEQELLSQLMAADNSSIYPAARLTQLIKNAYKWATNLFIWNDLVRAKCTGTIAGNDYYDYPAEFRSDTIIRVEIDGEPYDQINFEDFLQFRKDEPNSTEKLFANFGRQLFIFPTPTVTGDGNMDLWGAIQADDLVNSSTVSIFSGNKDSANESVVRKAFSVAVKRTDSALAKTEENGATAELSRLNQVEVKGRQRQKRKAHPMLNVPDFFAQSGSAIGNFFRR